MANIRLKYTCLLLYDRAVCVEDGGAPCCAAFVAIAWWVTQQQHHAIIRVALHKVFWPRTLNDALQRQGNLAAMEVLRALESATRLVVDGLYLCTPHYTRSSGINAIFGATVNQPGSCVMKQE